MERDGSEVDHELPLSGCSFEICCEDDPEEAFSYSEVIIELGAKIHHGCGASDDSTFQLARLHQQCGAGREAMRVTPMWLHFQYVKRRTWLQPDQSPLFRPLPAPDGIPTMREAVVSFTGLPGIELLHARLLLDAAKVGYSKQMQPGFTTHLVCANTEGEPQRRGKVAGAVHWKAGGGLLHIVRFTWLMECVRQWRRMDEASYPVELRSAPSRFQPMTDVGDEPAAEGRALGGGAKAAATGIGESVRPGAEGGDGDGCEAESGETDEGQPRREERGREQESGEVERGFSQQRAGEPSLQELAALTTLIDKGKQAEMSILKDVMKGGGAVAQVMLDSHVTGGFWLPILPGLRASLPRETSPVTMCVQLERWTMRYLAGEGFDDGWLGLAVDQRLCDGDAIVFQIMPPHKEAKKLQSDQGGGRAGPDISVHVFRKV